jgi:hypothetical protein
MSSQYGQFWDRASKIGHVFVWRDWENHEKSQRGGGIVGVEVEIQTGDLQIRIKNVAWFDFLVI